MRISDWSSDVCSSDLEPEAPDKFSQICRNGAGVARWLHRITDGDFSIHRRRRARLDCMSHRVDRKIDLFDKSVVALDFVYREALVREDEVRETVVTRQPHDPVGLDLECIGRNAGAAPGRTMEIIREMQECDSEWA